jgi:hypothetical protein
MEECTMKRIVITAATIAALLVLSAGLAGATTLTSDNSTLTYDDSSTFTAWTVEGLNNLFAEQWYYRVGSGSGALLAGPAMTVLAPNIGTVSYLIPNWGSVTMVHVLLGNELGSYNSQWSTTVSLRRNQGVTDTLHFYNYADYDLSQTSSDDTARFVGLGLFGQSDMLMQLTYNVSVPPRYIDILPYFTFNPNANLGNNAGPYTGDATFASQFVITGSAFSFSIDRSLNAVPEPGTYALIGAGLLGLGLLRRRMS